MKVDMRGGEVTKAATTTTTTGSGFHYFVFEVHWPGDNLEGSFPLHDHACSLPVGFFCYKTWFGDQVKQSSTPLLREWEQGLKHYHRSKCMVYVNRSDWRSISWVIVWSLWQRTTKLYYSMSCVGDPDGLCCQVDVIIFAYWVWASSGWS